MFLQKFFSATLIVGLLVMAGCESEACANYQLVCDHDVDGDMCTEILENQPSSLYDCILNAETCYEVHQCILNAEDESMSTSDSESEFSVEYGSDPK